MTWVLTNWREFDTWCLLKQINPWELPSYRFCGLVNVCMREGLEEEKYELLMEALDTCEGVTTPFRMKKVISTTRTTTQRVSDPATGAEVPTAERPIEEIKAEEFRAAGKPFIVPDWWRGEAVNAKVARSMMGTIPKNIGQDVK